MNSRPLPFYFRGLRAGIGGLRILALVGMVLSPVLLVMLTLGIPGAPSVGLAEIRFDPHSIDFKVTQDGQPEPVRLTNVSGTLEVPQDRPANDPLYRVALQSSLISQTVLALLYFVIFNFLFGLCRNIERGDLFTERNFGIVRRLGLSMIGLSILLALIQAWGIWRVGRFVAEHLAIVGPLSAPVGVGPGFGGFLTALSHGGTTGSFFFPGIVVLLVAEVFRQAVIIKQENDLTI